MDVQRGELSHNGITTASYEAMLSAKQQEVDLVCDNNNALQAGLGQVEGTIVELSEKLSAKNQALHRAEIKLEKSQHEVRGLEAIRRQLQGKDEAVLKANRQNLSLLQVLEQAVGECRRLAEENGALKAELARSTKLSERRLRRTVSHNERVRSALRLADREITIATLARIESAKLAETAQSREHETRLRVEAEAAVALDEASQHRQREFELEASLLEKEDLVATLEAQCEKHAAESALHAEQLAALESRLLSALNEVAQADQSLEKAENTLDAERAARSAVAASFAAERHNSNALKSSLKEMKKSRDSQLDANRRISAKLEKARVGCETANAELDKQKARNTHALAAHNLDKKELARCASQLDYANRLLRRNRERRIDLRHDQRYAKGTPDPRASTCNNFSAKYASSCAKQRAPRLRHSARRIQLHSITTRSPIPASLTPTLTTGALALRDESTPPVDVGSYPL